MDDRYKIACGVCGLLGPSLVADLPPSKGCLHDCPVDESQSICDKARIMVLEHALRRAVAPECFDHEGKILPGCIAVAIRKSHHAVVLSAAALRGKKPKSCPPS